MTIESTGLVTLLALAVSIVIPATIRAWDIGRQLADALEAAHMPRKAAADVMGMSEADLSRAIAGVGPIHLSADRLTRLPRLVWLHFYISIGEHLGLSEPAETRATDYAIRARRQAKAQLKPRDSQGGRDAAVA